MKKKSVIFLASQQRGVPGVAQEKLYKMMREHQAKGTCSHTFGALDTVQVRKPDFVNLGYGEPCRCCYWF